MDIYLIFVFVLFTLAIADLIVGVSNDAVNFLNSAIGSKVAPMKVIMIVASLGILFGAVFSNGMMEVARKGIFHPQYFMFTEIMVIFLAVMLTDILLLDFFNTIGLPTSTTVSIVFEILGAAVAVALLKVASGAQTIMIDGVETVAEVSHYINSSKALAIIGGILLSVVVSFTVGLVVQYISRVIFSFNSGRTIKYFGSLWGGIAIAAITYFILIKGVKSASFMSKSMATYISENWMLISLISLVAWTILLQLLHWLFKVNTLKVIVLIGTFALAMAFAGNDLVNFIGVPLAGFSAFNLSNGSDILMSGLAEKVQTPTYFLVIAGFVMVITLWFSKKARSVTETELNLSRQDEGQERFGSSIFARVLVRRIVTTSTFFSTILPESFTNKLKTRFDQTHVINSRKGEKNPPMFDLVRASVNLTVASVLIALATSYKLPLSTTYVTFMVAMGTSLADGAWGRDSAVYRITGVFTVIGGWFLTAITAFIVAFLVALLISWGGHVVVFVLLALAALAIFYSNRAHKRKAKEKDLLFEQEEEVITSAEDAVRKCDTVVVDALSGVAKNYSGMVDGLFQDSFKKLKEEYKFTKELRENVKSRKAGLSTIVAQLKENSVETAHHYVQVIENQNEMINCLLSLVRPVYDYVENSHKPLHDEQKKELEKLTYKLDSYISMGISIINENRYDDILRLKELQKDLLECSDAFRKNQIKRIKGKEVGTKNSMLYLKLISETHSLVLYVYNIITAQKEFVDFTKK